MLEKVADCLPSRMLLHDKQLSVLFVDEANRLKTLLQDIEGQAVLESIFEWLIHSTQKLPHNPSLK